MSAAGLIVDAVRQAIEEADVVLAVLTGHNPNVFYELGIALEVAARPVVLIARNKEDIPFDLRGSRFSTYWTGAQLSELPARLTEAIGATLEREPRARKAQPGHWNPNDYLQACADQGPAHYVPLRFRRASPSFIGRTADGLPVIHAQSFGERDLSWAVGEYVRLMIVAETGAGKSWLCRRIVAELAKRGLERADKIGNPTIPVYADLGNYESTEPDIIDFVVKEIARDRRVQRKRH